MIKAYSTNSFLHTKMAVKLYHSVAKNTPIVDYHNHLNIYELSENKIYRNISQLCIKNDPYKHRAMRMLGIPEIEITGKNADDRRIFNHWARVFPRTIGSPLFHWTQIELKTIFNVREILTEKTADSIWEKTSALLNSESMSAQNIYKHWDISHAFPAEDLFADIEAYSHIRRIIPDRIIAPSLRIDALIKTQSEFFTQWIHALEEATNITVKDTIDLQKALSKRLDLFAEAGCSIVDHGIDTFLYIETPLDEGDKLLKQLLQKKPLDKKQHVQLQSVLLDILFKEYATRKWNVLLHIGAERYTSSRLRQLAGPAGGYACIGNAIDITTLTSFLDAQEKRDSLPKLMLFNLNPADNAKLASLCGSYAEDGVEGKIQCGPAWWLNDHFEGIRNHLFTLANYGLLSTFAGMTTDSRSILSFSRHEYFRRILCDILGEWVNKGHIPNDFDFCADLIRKICYDNAIKWLTNKGA